MEVIESIKIAEDLIYEQLQDEFLKEKERKGSLKKAKV